MFANRPPKKLNPALLRLDNTEDGYLLYQQLLAHGDALIEPLLVFLQELLLLVYLSPQVTVGLARKKGWALSTFTADSQTTQRQRCDSALLTDPEQIVYPALFLLQVQALVALQGSEFQAS